MLRRGPIAGMGGLGVPSSLPLHPQHEWSMGMPIPQMFVLWTRRSCRRSRSVLAFLQWAAPCPGACPWDFAHGSPSLARSLDTSAPENSPSWEAAVFGLEKHPELQSKNAIMKCTSVGGVGGGTLLHTAGRHEQSKS